jgi:hypothetical protein
MSATIQVGCLINIKACGKAGKVAIEGSFDDVVFKVDSVDDSYVIASIVGFVDKGELIELCIHIELLHCLPNKLIAASQRDAYIDRRKVTIHGHH